MKFEENFVNEKFDEYDDNDELEVYVEILDAMRQQAYDRIAKKGYTQEEWDNLFPDASDFYQSLEWKIVRASVLKRDRCICFFNKRHRSARYVHHLNSSMYTPALALDMDNLVTSCKKCHDEYHHYDR